MTGWITTVIIIISYILQTTLAHRIAIFGAVPDIVLMIIICYAISAGREKGAVVGLITGIGVDLLSGGRFGFHTLMYMYMGALAGMFGGSLFGKNALTATLITGILSLVYGVVTAIALYITKQDRNIGYILLHHVLPSAVYNAVIGFFVYMLFDNIYRGFYRRQ